MFSKHNSKISKVNTNIIELLRVLSSGKIKTLDRLLHYANLYNTVCPAQTTIADETNLDRSTINRIIKYFVKIGLLIKQTRLWNTCIYMINPILNNTEVRWQLKDVFKSFQWMPKVLLASITLSQLHSINGQFQFSEDMSHHISLSFPSSSPNTYLYNNTSTTNVNTTTVEEVTRNVRNNRIESSAIKAELNNNNSYSLKKETVMLQKVKERLNLGEHETNTLSDFSDVVLGEALKVYESKKGITHPYRFFLGCCNRIKDKPQSKQALQTQSVYKPVAWVNTEAPVVNRDIEFLKREIENFKNHNLPVIMTAEGSLFYGFKEKMIMNLEEELAKLEPQSITINDVVVEQPNTQQDKNLSIEPNLIDINKYKTPENSEAINQWLKTLENPGYNPFDEEEDLDTPLLL